MMGGPLKAKLQIDLSGGENTTASPFDLTPIQVQQAQNVILDEHGSMRARDGTLTQTVVMPSPLRKIVKIFNLINVNATSTNLAIVSGTTSNLLFTWSATSWNKVGAFSGWSPTPDILSFVDSAIICNGFGDQIRAFSGSNFVVATPNAPSASHIAVHLGYLWAFGTNTSSTATDGPSSLRASDINVYNSWPAASQTFVAKDDGQTAQGLGVFTIAEAGISPTVTIIAFKDFSAYVVSGTFAASNLSVQKVKSDLGCVAPRTIQFISGFGIIRLSHRGFALYDGVNDTLISEEERPRIFGRDNYTALDWPNIKLSMAAQVANPPMYLCACPVSGGTGNLTRIFIYDLVRRAWTISTFANPITTLQLVLQPGQLPLVLGGDASAGFIRRYFAGDGNDDGTSIVWSIRTAPLTGGSPMDRLYVRRLLVETQGIAVGTVVTVTFFWGPNTLNVTKSITAMTASTAVAGYGNNQYGNAAYGDPVDSTIFRDQTLDFEPLGGIIANQVYSDISSSGAGKIRGFEWHYREKPATKSQTSVLQA